MLAARKILLEDGDLVGEATGEIEKEDDGVIVIKRIHVVHHLHAPDADPDAVRRSHDLHASRCPVARSLRAAIEITTEVKMV